MSRVHAHLARMPFAKQWLPMVFLWIAGSSVVFGQGLLLGPGRLPRPWIVPNPPPHPVDTYQIGKVVFRARVDQQVARVTVDQVFVNTGHRPIEASFVFPLPEGGAVDQMTFLVDGKEVPGRLLSADEATRIYQDYLRRNRDPALLQWVGNGMFRTKVFPIPAGASRTVQLRYSQLCHREFGLTELLLPLRTMQFSSKPIRALVLDVSIRSDDPIKNVYSPSHSVQIERPRPEEARIKLTARDVIPTDDFRLLFDVGKDAVSTRIISYRPDRKQDGYFLMLISPDLPTKRAEIQPKNVIFVLDRSGSMSGKKIEQARQALKFVLRNLRKGDRFNIVAYDSEVETYRPELQRFDADQLDDALGFVSGIEAGGSTNIDAALRRAMGMVPTGDDRPTYVVFLTDGRPTVGVTQESRIADAAEKANRSKARLFCFGLGYDVNSRLLDKLARGNHGYSVYVRPNEDIEESVAKLYRRIEAPAMVDVRVVIDVPGHKPGSAPDTYRVYPRELTDLFAGDQLVMVGRYRRPGNARITVQGKLNGKAQSYEFEGKFVRRSKDGSHAYVEKLWAIRRVGEIIDEIDLHGKNDELVKELMDLAKRHGILTPYTSFLADETKPIGDMAWAYREADSKLAMLSRAAGRAGFVQRQRKAELQQAAQASDALAPAGGYAEDAYGAAGSGVGLGGAVGGGGAGEGAARPAHLPAVRQAGPWTFYFRDQKWLDSRITAEQLKAAQRVDKLGDELVELLTKYGPELGKAIALPGTVVVQLDGKVYEFFDESGADAAQGK